MSTVKLTSDILKAKSKNFGDDDDKRPTTNPEHSPDDGFEIEKSKYYLKGPLMKATTSINSFYCSVYYDFNHGLMYSVNDQIAGFNTVPDWQLNRIYKIRNEIARLTGQNIIENPYSSATLPSRKHDM